MALSRKRIFRVHLLNDSPHFLGSAPYLLAVRSKPPELIGNELVTRGPIYRAADKGFSSYIFFLIRGSGEIISQKARQSLRGEAETGRTRIQSLVTGMLFENAAVVSSNGQRSSRVAVSTPIHENSCRRAKPCTD
jgi:hypothetical protein